MSQDNVMFGTTDLAAQRAQSAHDAAMQALTAKRNVRFGKGEKTIALPFGKRIAAKPYASMRFANRQNWWLSAPIDLILPEYRDPQYQMPDGTWCLAWPNSTEEGTTMYLAGDGFEPVHWGQIDKTLGARVRTHVGPTAREEEKDKGFVYWKRHILVWVSPALWEEEHVTPILRGLSMLANVEEDFQEHFEDASNKITGQNLVEAEVKRTTVQATAVGSTPPHMTGE